MAAPFFYYRISNNNFHCHFAHLQNKRTVSQEDVEQ